MTLQQTIDQGIAHHQAGRLAEAEAAYRQALASEPNHPHATHLLGLLAYNIGRLQDAEQLMRRAIALDSSRPDFFCNFGLVLAAQNKPDEAIEIYHQALRLQPNYAEASNNLGVVLYEQKKYPQAIECYRQAISLQPAYVDAINNLGNALSEIHKTDEAIACYQQVIALRPDYAPAYNNLGDIHVEQDRLDEGLACFYQACALQKDYAEAYSNIANVMYRKTRLDEAVQFGREATRLKPDFATPHWNLGLSLLCQGKFAEGWKEYAWRTRVKDLQGACREFPQPLWEGADLAGKTILLHAEQGLGDTLQFIRYLPQVKAKAARVIVDCGQPLQRLLKSCFIADQWLSTGDPVPLFDLHCPMLSLPMAFGTTLQTIPAHVPYLFADAAESQHWKERLSRYTGLKIGLAWAGRPEHGNDRNRSISLSTLAPLIESARGHATFFSLQKGPPAQQIKSLPGGLELIDWTGELNDFADTAALLGNLDLLISVDTAIVHLAGAMNKPAWVLLPFAPDWRWMLHRPDSPWYPSLRLFRQPQPGDWNTPIAQTTEALAALTARRVS